MEFAVFTENICPCTFLCLILFSLNHLNIVLDFFFDVLLLPTYKLRLLKFCLARDGFLRQDLSMYPWMSWYSLCRSGWPQTHRGLSASVSLCTKIKSMCRHDQLPNQRIFFSFLDFTVVPMSSLLALLTIWVLLPLCPKLWDYTRGQLCSFLAPNFSKSIEF